VRCPGTRAVLGLLAGWQHRSAPLWPWCGGEFYNQEELQGRSVFVRIVWSEITNTS
jgi:hypothetical protein